MGSAISNKRTLPPISDRDFKKVMSYNIDEKHIHKLYRKFNDIDDEQNGYWTTREVYKLAKESRLTMHAPIVDYLLFVADGPGLGAMSFQDFLVAFTSFCALSREEVLQYLFIVIDIDRNGIVSKEELVEFFSYAPVGTPDSAPSFPVNNKNALDIFRGGKWEGLEFEGLAKLCEHFPYIAFPAFHIQDQFRRQLLGTKFWEKLDEDRRKANSGLDRNRIVRLPGSHQIIQLERPGRTTMKELLEYSRRKTAVRGGRRVEKKKQKGSNISKITEARDEVLARTPLLNMIRNPKCQYHVPYIEQEVIKTSGPVNSSDVLELPDFEELGGTKMDGDLTDLVQQDSDSGSDESSGSEYSDEESQA